MSTSQVNNSASLLVAPLSYFKHTDLDLAGGKGANLGELLNAGFAIPSGFIVTTAAYDHLLQTDGIQAQIDDFLASCDFDNSDAVRKTSQRLSSLFEGVSIPGELTNDILKAYHEMDEGAVAVRSSATAEDLPEAAFAGQQETFLNILGAEELIGAIRACWSSLWSERAILYRRRQGVDQATVKLAVVVQKMIPADAAGVMFTANPVNGERGELIIDANPGLGEAVVAGLATPDHFVMNKRIHRISEHRLGRREAIIRAKKDGGTEQTEATKETPKTYSIPVQALGNLCQLGINIERHFGAPQDIEWA